MTESVRKISDKNTTVLGDLEKKLTEIKDDRDLYNKFVENDLDFQKKFVAEMIKANKTASDSLKKLGLNTLADDFTSLNKDLEAISAKLDMLEPATDENWEEMQKNVQDILDIISGKSSEDGKGAASAAEKISSFLKGDDLEKLDKKLRRTLADTKSSIAGMQKSLNGMGGLLADMGEIFAGYNGSLGNLEGSMDSTRSDLISMRQGVDVLAALMAEVAGDGELSETDRVLSDNTDRFSSYLASPVQMGTEVIYPIKEYGSAMAPFYTVLAQWVGALLTAVLIKVKVKKREDLPDPALVERFFGRYGLYMMIGIAQALIVSLGDLLYVGIQCLHPLLFVLEACANGICFMMINYALVFALDNIGMGIGVIILVLQVAGSGGTYPVEVLPNIFKVLYPFMPFRYAMDAMRECIGGTYGHTYIRCMGMLGVFVIVSVILGLLLYRPALWINRLITESKRKSDIML